MKINSGFAYSQGSTVFNTPGSYPLKFKYSNQDITGVTKNNQDAMEKLYIEFASVTGTATLQLGYFLENVGLVSYNPTGIPSGKFVPIGGLSNLAEINPITPSAFGFDNVTNVYGLVYQILQTNVEEDFGMLLTLGAASSITGLNIGITNEVKGFISGS